MIVTKELFLAEAKKIFKEYPSAQTNEIFNRVEDVYAYASGEKDIDDVAKAEVEKILEFLFKLPSQYVIPYSFIKGPVGRVLFAVLFGKNEKYYSSIDVTKMMGMTRALISYDLKMGNLVADQYGGRRNILIYESDLKSYMESKGMDKKEIDTRIKLYNEYKKMGIDENIIQQKIEENINK